jgi:hypothetical protein
MVNVTHPLFNLQMGQDSILPSGYWYYNETDKSLRFLRSENSQVDPNQKWRQENRVTRAPPYSYVPRIHPNTNATENSNQSGKKTSVQQFHTRSFADQSMAPHFPFHPSNHFERTAQSQDQGSEFVFHDDLCDEQVKHITNSLDEKLHIGPVPYTQQETASKLPGPDSRKTEWAELPKANYSEQPLTTPHLRMGQSFKHPLAPSVDTQPAWAYRTRVARGAAANALYNISANQTKDLSDLYESFEKAESPSMKSWESVAIYNWIAQKARGIAKSRDL